jgi:hypothetical protein
VKTPSNDCVTAEGLLCQRCPHPLVRSSVVDVFGRYVYSKSFVRKHMVCSPRSNPRTENARMDPPVERAPNGCVSTEGLLCQRCPQPLFRTEVVGAGSRYTYSASFVVYVCVLHST